MSLFSTEFYLKPEVDKAAFLAEARAWAQGIRSTALFGADSRETRDGDNLRYDAASGESLMLRALGRDDGLVAVGCCHDLPAPNGLQWRTEAVMRRTQRGNLLRIRAQCLPTRPLAVTETPKRTHLIRSLIENGRVMDDGPFAVQTGAHRLGGDGAAARLAADIACGRSGAELPVVYLSAADSGAAVLTDKEIGQLAKDLCGVAHVVVEPSRAFAFALRDLSAGRNVYGGTVGIALTGRGFVRRFYIGAAYPDGPTLAEAVRRAAVELRTAMPSGGGWDWLNLQEAILADQRQREKSRLSAAENEALWQDELAAKEDRIRELEARVADLSRGLQEAQTRADPASPLPTPSLSEIYGGEFSDRIRAALDFCVGKGADAGWDKRSLAVFAAFLKEKPPASDMEELRAELQSAARDAKRFNAALRSLLSRHGFVDKSDNKHSRMEPRPDFPGLDSVTLMKTPGDHRGMLNFVSQVEANLGITRLKQRS